MNRSNSDNSENPRSTSKCAPFSTLRRGSKKAAASKQPRKRIFVEKAYFDGRLTLTPDARSRTWVSKASFCVKKAGQTLSHLVLRTQV